MKLVKWVEHTSNLSVNESPQNHKTGVRKDVTDVLISYSVNE